MRIYLDSNVFRDLKKPENKVLYELILADKERNYYYFSEAHIQDLVQDSTDKKLDDMEFMETIVGNNAWHYTDRTDLEYWSPRTFYANFKWKEGTELMTNEGAIYVEIREQMRAIPVHIGSLIDSVALPADFPDDLKPLLLESVTMLDFMEAMLELTDALAADQSRFKRLLQYFHRSMTHPLLFEHMGIQGYDGKSVTDMDAFATSFSEMVMSKANKKDWYNYFIDAQYMLDTFGIVKGKPKKQKFMSLLNDGKHAFYAGHGHLLVTSDEDMIAKTSLLYRVFGLDTEIVRPEEFHQYLLNERARNTSVKALFEQFERAAELPTAYENYTLDEMIVKKDLPNWYVGAFNALTCASAAGYRYFYFDQGFSKLSFGTTAVEIERVLDELLEHFGPDALGQGKFDRNELADGTWKGRDWRVGDMGVVLRAEKGMVITFFKAAPLTNVS